MVFYNQVLIYCRILKRQTVRMNKRLNILCRWRPSFSCRHHEKDEWGYTVDKYCESPWEFCNHGISYSQQYWAQVSDAAGLPGRGCPAGHCIEPPLPSHPSNLQPDLRRKQTDFRPVPTAPDNDYLPWQCNFHLQQCQALTRYAITSFQNDVHYSNSKHILDSTAVLVRKSPLILHSDLFSFASSDLLMMTSCWGEGWPVLSQICTKPSLSPRRTKSLTLSALPSSCSAEKPIIYKFWSLKILWTSFIPYHPIPNTSETAGENLWDLMVKTPSRNRRDPIWPICFFFSDWAWVTGLHFLQIQNFGQWEIL